jgi:hypothetical protein
VSVLGFEFEEDIRGRRFAFAGRFVRWPSFLGGDGPEEHVQQRGGVVVTRVEEAQYLVVGSKKKKGLADALRKAEKLRAKGVGPRPLTERELVHLLRPRLAGRSFLLAGGFSAGLDLDGPAALVTAAGGRVASAAEESVDFVVVGGRRAKGKAGALRRIEELRVAGTSFRELDEETFLELLACVGGPSQSGFDARGLAVQLRTFTDPKKVDRAIQMLKRESFQLYNEVADASLAGVVRSQSQEDGFYACWIGDDGRYGCFDAQVAPCWGQQGGICKHVLVLLLGLVVERELPARRAYAWASAASSKKPAEDPQRSAELVLRYRGALAGEVDWRPTETVPEDYYTL